YLFYQYRLLTGPPSLEISSPTGTLSVNQSTLEVIGKTDPEATISVNGQLVALDKGGSFSLRIPLELGSNEIVVTAIAKSGRKSTISKTVNRVDNSAPSR
ncbi:MAG: Peptidoglycan-binding lysin domain protein, partial [Candidatus Amesbacteria bacterium GW2011_GWA1_48_9]